uniref:ATP-binding cassette domain-containing protein n=1 Tax=Streptomyces acidiscabies TaxID=42234 RepID=UPI00117DFBC4
HRPGELSGGQQQRVALARALITRPRVLFGDEPTGALDSTTGREVLRLLRGMVDTEGQTVVMVTHDPLAASYADQVLFLVDGRVHGELAGAGAETIAARMAGLTAGTRPGSRHTAPDPHGPPGPDSARPGPQDAPEARQEALPC